VATTEPIAPDLRARPQWMDTGQSVDERVDVLLTEMTLAGTYLQPPLGAENGGTSNLDAGDASEVSFRVHADRIAFHEPGPEAHCRARGNRGVRRYLGPRPALPGTRTADRCRACRGSRPPTRHAHRLPAESHVISA